MHRAPAVASVLATLALAGCSDGKESEAGGPVAEPSSSATAQPTLAPAVDRRMQLARTTYHAGDRVRVRWPGEQLRGIGYQLDEWTGTGWEVRYYLSAVTSGYNRKGEPTWWSVDEDGYGWVDIGVGGAGPDVVVVPDVASPGTYRLCTANSPRLSCALIDVR
ncbi:hypothetical protein [Nocardioides pelophilus]|uniref:hypothetical protein n=1 Tax=Nocardioides pelophilus TaxID=2172019 RepID=UPI0016030BD8|nr:hypothetical protein [Nocardioides pelophilus]